jgi:hypothetical protein
MIRIPRSSVTDCKRQPSMAAGPFRGCGVAAAQRTFNPQSVGSNPTGLIQKALIV